jgi:hypothetical protein
MLCPGKPTRKDDSLCPTDGHIISILNTLNGPQCLGHTLGLIGELEEELSPNGLTTQGRTDSANRARDTSTRSLQNKVIKVIALHELQDIASQGHLLVI